MTLGTDLIIAFLAIFDTAVPAAEHFFHITLGRLGLHVDLYKCY